MSRHYAPEEKDAALAALHANHGSVPRTSLQTGIPERTLYTWRRELWRQRRQNPDPAPPPPPPTDPPADASDTTEAMTYIRQRIITELMTLIQSFEQDFALSSPYQRVQAISQLLDRVLKLNDYRPPEETVFRIEYEDPDDAWR